MSLNPHHVRISISTVDSGIVGPRIVNFMTLYSLQNVMPSCLNGNMVCHHGNRDIKIGKVSSQWKGMSLARVCDLMGIIYPC